MTGERLVGYQTRRESRVTTFCQLTYCTTAVFFRTLIENDFCLKGLTHVIIDQVHERDRFTDVLMGVLRIRLVQFADLKLILLGASIAQLDTLSQYFGQRNIIDIGPTTNPTLDYFLEDILTSTQFMLRKNNDTPVGPWRKFDQLLTEAWFKGSDGVFGQLLELARDGTMAVDYQHSKTGINLLMAAAIHGKVHVVKSAIAYGANPTFQVY